MTWIIKPKASNQYLIFASICCVPLICLHSDAANVAPDLHLKTLPLGKFRSIPCIRAEHV